MDLVKYEDSIVCIHHFILLVGMWGVGIVRFTTGAYVGEKSNYVDVHVVWTGAT